MTYLIIYLKGLGMGAADVVPGVSGGTVAFITGIYERLLKAIASVNLELLHLLWKRKFVAAWRHMDAGFLFALLLGIVTAFAVLARVVLFLMNTAPEMFWAAMAGLILASTILVWRQLKTWKWWYVVLLLVGLSVAFLIGILAPGQTPDALWFIFLSGAIAICAMILPGISGSFILVLLQKYEFMMLALKEFNIPVIIVFILGCLVGLLSFARLLKFLFKRYHDATVVVMAGFMLGSLVKLWPWKQVLSTYVDSKGHEKPLASINVLPDTYAQLGMDPQVGQVIIAFLVGIAVVLLIEYLAKRKAPITVIKA